MSNYVAMSHPLNVIASCVTPEQLGIAQVYCELWLRRNGFPRTSAPAEYLWKRSTYKVLQLLRGPGGEVLNQPVETQARQAHRHEERYEAAKDQ